VFIYDAKSRGSTAKDDKDSTGNFNNGQPILRIDYARIYDGASWNKAAVFQHEMGHESPKTTALYTQLTEVTQQNTGKIINRLVDRMNLSLDGEV